VEGAVLHSDASRVSVTRRVLSIASMDSDEENLGTVTVKKLCSHFTTSFIVYRFNILNRYVNILECINEIEDDVIEFLNPILDENEYVRIQFVVHVNMFKRRADGIKDIKTWIVNTKAMFLNTGDSLMEMFDAAGSYMQNKLECKDAEESGWSVDKIVLMEINLYKSKNSSRALLGSYVKWPVGCPAFREVVNIQTENNCVLLSMVAHFRLQLGAVQNRTRPNNYIAVIDNYFSFPTDLEGPIAIDDFPKIERSCRVNLMMYKLSKDNGKYTIHVIYRGGRKQSNERTIHLIQILDNKHVALIPNFSKFMHTFKNSHSSSADHVYCDLCLRGMNHGKIETHTKICSSTSGLQNIVMPGPNDTYHFNATHALVTPPVVAYYDTEAILEPAPSDGRVVNTHKMAAYKYIILNKNNEIVSHRMMDSEHVPLNRIGEDLIENLLIDYNKYMSHITLYEKAVLTPTQVKLFNEQKCCEVCSVVFDYNVKSNRKIRHHDHYTPGAINPDGLIIEGNYLGALCNQCNLRYTEKVRFMPVIAHNASFYDMKFILVSLDKDKFQTPNVLSKSGDSMFSITTKLKIDKTDEKVINYGIKFIDSCNFMNSSLDKLSRNLVESKHELTILDEHLSRIGYNREVIRLARNKGYFCYEAITCDSVLNETSVPTRERFHSNLRGGTISESEYVSVHEMWEAAGCKNLRDYMRIYLIIDVLLLTEVFEKFRKTLKNAYILDPVHFVSAPGFAMQSALYDNKMKFALIQDYDLLNSIAQHTRGGFVTVVKPYCKLNNIHTPDYDPTKPSSSAIFLDFNSMYAELLCTKLPVGEIYEFSVEEVEKFDLKESCRGEYTYIVSVDTKISPEIARKTDDLPLTLTHMNVTHDDLSDYTKEVLRKSSKLPRKNLGRKLVAVHKPQTQYLVALELLQVLISYGLEVTKVHKVVRMRQAECFTSFIEKNIAKRKEAANSFERGLYKLLSNSIFGKLLFNPLKRNEEVKLVTSADTFHKHSSNPLLKRCYPISQDKLIMVLAQREIKMSHPTYAGYMILEKAKKKIYTFFYDVLKPHYGDAVKLVYSDTDSLLLLFEGVHDIEVEMAKEPLKTYMDFSNLKGNKLYDTSRQGELGLLKSETGSDYPNEIVCLQPKAYSILLNSDTVKSTAKGVKQNIQENLTHKLYKQIYMEEVFHHVETIYNITSHHCQLQTTVMNKNCLSRLETKRYHVNGDCTLGYGHPDIVQQNNVIAEVGVNNGEPVTIQHRPAKRPNNMEVVDMPLDLTCKRRRPGELIYGNSNNSN
jgi:hypothetical protein